MAFNMFPYSNLHNLNLDWILNTVKTMAAAVEAAAGTVETYAARLTQAETNIQAITPAANGAVRHDVSQALDAANRRRAATNIHAVSYDATLLSADERSQARSNIGAAASADIPDVSDVVRVTAQTFSTLQKAQARANIEAVSSSQLNTLDGRVQTLESNTVRVTSQSFTDAQKTQARTNIGAIAASDVPSITGAVVYNEAQSLTDSQKLQARNNINAAVSGSYLRYDAQSLTAAQKQQARSNIGVSGAEDQPLIVTVLPNELQTGYECDTTVADIIEAVEYGRLIIVLFTPISSSTEYQCMAYIDPVSSPNTVVAYACDPADPGSVTPFDWYRIYLAAGSGSDTLIVTQQSGRMVPIPQAGDTGKLLGVANNGRTAWQQILPETVTDLSSTSITLANAVDNTIYEYGELTSLTVSNPPATGAYSIVFTSGATATTTTFPATILGLESFAAEANTVYEINVLDNRAVVGSWAVSA